MVTMGGHREIEGHIVRGRTAPQRPPSSATPRHRNRILIGIAVVLAGGQHRRRGRLQEARGQHQRRSRSPRPWARTVPTPSDVEGPKEPLNVLVMGSDNRDGTNIGGDTPGLSDTTILLHLSADRKRAYGVSIPRDAMVERPGLQIQERQEHGPGRPDPVQRGVRRRRTRLHDQDRREDHQHPHRPLRGDQLRGFKEMVNAVNGVEVCVPEEVNDDVGTSTSRRAPTRSTATRPWTTCGCGTASVPRPATSAG